MIPLKDLLVGAPMESLIFLIILLSLIAVIISHRLKFGVVIGYICAGVLAGPAVLDLLKTSVEIEQVSELGVVFLLFLIGLELNPKKLMELKSQIFLTGSLQVALCSLLLFAPMRAMGLNNTTAFILSAALSLASTPMIVSSFKERNVLNTSIGQRAFSVLLFQDIAIIPMIFAITFLAVDEGSNHANVDFTGLVKSIAAILSVIILGKYLLRPVFRFVAQLDSREIFTAFSLALILGISVIMHAAGLSMALGSFLAGVLLAESEYRAQLELDINPFKGLLLGLFFVTIGIKLDVEYFLTQPFLVVACLLAYLLIKGIGLFVIARVQRNNFSDSLLFAFALAQGGEFAFVLLALGEKAQLIPIEWSRLASLVIVLSFLSSPLLLMLHAFLNRKLLKIAAPDTSEMELKESVESDVIIAGYGRVGQIIGRILMALKYRITILDFDASQIETMRKFGWKGFYGDVRNLDLLRLAGAGNARLIVIAIDDSQAAFEAVELVHQHFPQLRVLVRVRNRADAFRFLNIGVLPFRETFGSAIEMATSALQVLGVKEEKAKTLTQKFANYDVNIMYEQAPFAGDQKSLIAMNQRSKDTLQSLLSDESLGAVDLGK